MWCCTAPTPPRSRSLTSSAVERLSDDVLVLVAHFLPISDLLSCSVISFSLHPAFDGERVWQPRLPPSTVATSQTVSASSKSRYIALHACSEHGLQRCFRLLPLSEPILCPALPPSQLAYRRRRHQPIPSSPKPAVTPLPLCRACTRAIAECELDRLPARSRGYSISGHSLSCLVRLSRTKYDARYSAAEERDIYVRCSIVPVTTARSMLSRHCFGSISPVNAGSTRYRCTAWLWPFIDRSMGACAAHFADNVDWPGSCPRTARRELQCEEHSASGCWGVLHHYEQSPLRGRRKAKRCGMCRALISVNLFLCSLCQFAVGRNAVWSSGGP